MNSSKQKWLNAIITLFISAIISGVFVLVFTFGGSFSSPDATITYAKHNLEWDLPLDDNDSAILNIFGEPEAGEELPLIHPESKGRYYIRLNNEVTGNIGYTVYLYCENEHAIPLKFNITRNEEMQETDTIPSDLEGVQVLDKVSGTVKGKALETFEIDWFWDGESDAADTLLGNKAVLEDLKYTIHMLIVVEDNNVYSSGRSKSSARLLHHAYVHGYPDNSFRPNGNILRSETAAIFARIAVNFDEDALALTSSKFSDVKNSEWHTKYIAHLENAGIISGYPDGSFGPNNPISRGEFVAICVRYYEKMNGKANVSEKEFDDLDKSNWAYDTIKKAVELGYITGYPDGTVRPNANITRAEVVVIVNRMLGRFADKDFIDKNQDKLTTFSDIQDNSFWAYYDILSAANTHYTQKKTNGQVKWTDVQNER